MDQREEDAPGGGAAADRGVESSRQLADARRSVTLCRSHPHSCRERRCTQRVRHQGAAEPPPADPREARQVEPASARSLGR